MIEQIRNLTQAPDETCHAHTADPGFYDSRRQE